MKEQILIVGAGGHAKSLADSIESMGRYEIAGFVVPPGSNEVSYRQYHTVGTDNDLRELFCKGIESACIGIGYLGHGSLRRDIYEILDKIGFELPNIIDGTAVLAADARLGKACFVGKNAVVNSNAQIGNCVIINTGAIVEHDCRVDDYSHVAVSAVMCGGASVGTDCLVGANATVIQGVSVGNHTIIGAGAVVRKDVGAHRTVI